MVHHEFLLQGHTVNKKLREAIRQKRTKLWKNQSRILHHDSTPAHTSMLVLGFLVKNKTVIMPQPTFLQDLAPVDFFPIPKTEDTDESKAFCYD